MEQRPTGCRATGARGRPSPQAPPPCPYPPPACGRRTRRAAPTLAGQPREAGDSPGALGSVAHHLQAVAGAAEKAPGEPAAQRSTPAGVEHHLPLVRGISSRIIRRQYVLGEVQVLRAHAPSRSGAFTTPSAAIVSARSL